MLNSPKAEGLTALINEIANKIECPTIVIDEANIAFTLKDNSMESKTALALFTKMTKLENKVTRQTFNIMIGLRFPALDKRYSRLKRT